MSRYSCSINLDSDSQSESLRIPNKFPDWVTWLVFAVGLTGALSLRLILIAKAYKPELIRLFWYIGVCGNMLFFLFRTYITNRRRKLITGLDLVNKLKDEQRLCPEDYEALRYLVASLQASKERWNYLIIFGFSLIAIAWDLFMNR